MGDCNTTERPTAAAGAKVSAPQRSWPSPPPSLLSMFSSATIDVVARSSFDDPRRVPAQLFDVTRRRLAVDYTTGRCRGCATEGERAGHHQLPDHQGAGRYRIHLHAHVQRPPCSSSPGGKRKRASCTQPPSSSPRQAKVNGLAMVEE